MLRVFSVYVIGLIAIVNRSRFDLYPCLLRNYLDK
jgi:hypothetical protein